MLRRQFLAAPLVLIAAPARAAAPTAPVEIVKFFYAFSAGKNGKWDGPSAFFDDAIRKDHFAQSLRDLIDEEGKLAGDEMVGAIDFDPISNSQDPVVRALKILPVSQTADKARVGASFARESKASAPREMIYYDFVLEGGKWRLYDILLRADASAKEPSSSIRASLEESIKEMKANPPKP